MRTFAAHSSNVMQNKIMSNTEKKMEAISGIEFLIDNSIDMAIKKEKLSMENDTRDMSASMEDLMVQEEVKTEHIDFNEELPSCSASDELIKRILGNCLITTETQYERPEPIVEYQGVPLIRSGNITTILGAPKVGKTFLTTTIGASLCKKGYMGLTAAQKKKCLHIDTEQEPYDTQELLLRLEKMVGHPIKFDSMVMANIRSIPVEERSKLIEECLQKGKFDVVFIDGIRDFVYNINDPAECTRIVNDLLRLCDTYHVSIVVVIHKNKNDDFARGHLGTELTNKSDLVIDMEKKGDVIQISPLLSRKKAFDTFYLTIMEDENDGIAIPIINNTKEVVEHFTKPNKAAADEREKKMNHMISLLEAGKEYTKSEIYKLTGYPESTCSRYIDDKIKDKTLRQTVNKKVILNTTQTNQPL